MPLFDHVGVLLFYYPDFKEVVRSLAADLHVCLSKDLGRAWPEVRQIILKDGQSSVHLNRDRQDNWILGT